MLRSLILTDHYDLGVRTEKMHGSDAIGSSKDADLLCKSGEHLQRLFSFLAVSRLVREAVHPQQPTNCALHL